MRRDLKVIVPAYEVFIKRQYCLIRQPASCVGLVGWHHVVARGQRQSKRNDFLTIPLCIKHHSEIEQIGIEKFNVKHNLDTWKELAWFLVSFIVEKELVPMTFGKSRYVSD